MKNRLLQYAFIGLLLALIAGGCAKQPSEEIASAKSSVDAMIADGAEKFTPEDAKRVGDALSAAMDEVRAQDAKVMKNFDKAREMLARVRTDAEAIKAGLPVKKEEARKNAAAGQETARAAVEETKGLLAKASKGKVAKTDAERLTADLTALEGTLPEIQKLIDGEDFLAAAEKAKAVKEKTDALTEEIRQLTGKPVAKQEAKPVTKTEQSGKKEIPVGVAPPPNLPAVSVPAKKSAGY